MKLASIEEIKDVIKHPNADSLDIVSVLGYKAIVKRNQYNVGDLIVFIQPDTVLPDAEWSKIYKAKSSRVKAIKLRGSWSMGIVESLSILSQPVTRNDITHQAQLSPLQGVDVTDLLGVTKYEPPISNDLGAKGYLPYGLGKTDEERYQSVDNIPYGQVVDVSLKIDGSSLTVFCKLVNNVWIVGVTSRTLELDINCINKYTTVVNKLNLIEKLKNYCIKYNVSLALRGEMYGDRIQKSKLNPHSTKPLGFALFNVYNLDTLEYEGINSIHYYNNVSKIIDIESVPMIEQGVVLTPELIKKYDEELETINGQYFEGVVIKLADGSSFKVISKHYDSKK